MNEIPLGGAIFSIYLAPKQVCWENSTSFSFYMIETLQSADIRLPNGHFRVDVNVHVYCRFMFMYMLS
jgi:hypothetical protein